jgi:hypothetical protein
VLQPKDSHVKGSWRIDIPNADELPLVTVRLGPESVNELFYGRILSTASKGHITSIFFTAHCWDEAQESEPEDSPSMNLADIIISHLLRYSGDLIQRFEDLSVRPLEPLTGPTELCRVSIEGYMIVKRKLE